MIRLELTLNEAARLRQCLSDLRLTPTNEELQTVWDKLVEAEANATQQTQCPVCQGWFTQGKAGRTGHYCSAACKQKAYRQRRSTWQKQVGPMRQR